MFYTSDNGSPFFDNNFVTEISERFFFLYKLGRVLVDKKLSVLITLI